jgi:hypothetical protein
MTAKERSSFILPAYCQTQGVLLPLWALWLVDALTSSGANFQTMARNKHTKRGEILLMVEDMQSFSWRDKSG